MVHIGNKVMTNLKLNSLLLMWWIEGKEHNLRKYNTYRLILTMGVIRMDKTIMCWIVKWMKTNRSHSLNQLIIGFMIVRPIMDRNI